MIVQLLFAAHVAMAYGFHGVKGYHWLSVVNASSAAFMLAFLISH